MKTEAEKGQSPLEVQEGPSAGPWAGAGPCPHPEPEASASEQREDTVWRI